MQIFKSVKSQLIAFLVIFAFFLAAKEKSAAFLFNLALAVFFCLLIEAAVIYFRDRKFRLNQSPVITGLIIGLVLSSDQSWTKFLAACLLAILSKFIFLHNKKHIFNPAALGIFLCLVLSGAWAAWRGTYIWYLLVPAGLYFAYRMRKLPVLAGYFLAALTLFGLQAVWQKAPLGNIAGYFSYFYIFIMVTEPKTSPVKPARQLFFGAGAALLIFVFTEAAVKFDAELASLLIMNLAAALTAGWNLKKAVK